MKFAGLSQHYMAVFMQQKLLIIEKKANLSPVSSDPTNKFSSELKTQ